MLDIDILLIRLKEGKLSKEELTQLNEIIATLESQLKKEYDEFRRMRMENELRTLKLIRKKIAEKRLSKIVNSALRRVLLKDSEDLDLLDF